MEMFGTMIPMQFLVSLLDLPTNVTFKALDYWPDGYKDERGGVIVRRDIGYAENNVQDGRNQQQGISHQRGGLQTFSYVCLLCFSHRVSSAFILYFLSFSLSFFFFLFRLSFSQLQR